eukprot:4352336-Amphidinium_carterae.2
MNSIRSESANPVRARGVKGSPLRVVALLKSQEVQVLPQPFFCLAEVNASCAMAKLAIGKNGLLSESTENV